MQLAKGDLVIVRARDAMLGAAIVERIGRGTAVKERIRCPTCGTTGVRPRKKALPRWRCYAGHEFETPKIERATVKTYEAHFSNTFTAAPDAVPVELLKKAALRPNDQLSIEEIDVGRLETLLIKRYAKTANLIALFVQSLAPDDDDAMGEGDNDPDEPFSGSMSDQRKKVLMAIRMRRGQRKFRNKLIKRYSAACMISGCTLLGVIEACHIWPYRGEQDNHPANGLLLRADLHTLFDLNLLAIEPATLEVHFHPSAASAGYANLHRKALRVPARKKPAPVPLQQRWDFFLEKLALGTLGRLP
jgi:hypothetical protein